MAALALSGNVSEANAIAGTNYPTQNSYRGKPLPRKVWKAKKRASKLSRASRKANF